MCFLSVFFVYIEKCTKSNKIRALRDVSAKKDFFAIISQRKKQKYSFCAKIIFYY